MHKEKKLITTAPTLESEMGVCGYLYLKKKSSCTGCSHKRKTKNRRKKKKL